MSVSDFLVEVGTEELPPKALKKLSEAFQNLLVSEFDNAGIKHGETTLFAAPRRIALSIKDLETAQPDESFERKGPAVQAAFDKDGNPSKAAQGFARSCGVTVDDLEQQETPKGTWLVYKGIKKGVATRELIADAVQKTLDSLPIPKRMRWGASRSEFVRPLQWLVLLFEDKVVPANIYGVESGNTTLGHRFHTEGEIEITSPSAYEEILESKGFVIPAYAKRMNKIAEGAKKAGEDKGLTTVINEDLLEEVASLNEWPVALVGQFEERFLDVPAEALVSSMEEHQKYFHTVNDKGEIQPSFVFIANLESTDPIQVIEGNEKVIRPRLADAAFFWETDKKHTLASRAGKLATILFQKELGTLADKSTRLQAIAVGIAEQIGGDKELAQRAAVLAKTDLLTDMVFEFTDLQGIAGKYYAQNDGENAEVAAAMEEQYKPAGAGDSLPETKTGIALALADRLDNLTGLFGIGQPPSGTKDPFALRRAALGVLRIILEHELDLDLNDLIALAITQHNFSAEQSAKASKEVFEYILDRFGAMYAEQGIPAQVVHAVRAKKEVTQALDFDRRVKAVHSFYQHEAAESLAAANKRVSNILAKNADQLTESDVDESLLQEDAEKALASALNAKIEAVKPLFEKADFNGALEVLAELKEEVDPFFDSVMVMAEDGKVRVNRLALVQKLRNLFLEVADISLLQAS